MFEFIDKYKEIKDFNKNSISFLKKYGTLWLGISSKNDEAIQGLKFTLSKKFKEVNVLNNFNKNIRFTIQNLLIMFISKTIKIPLNSGIKRLLQNFAHGNDIPTAFLENLSVSPLKNHVDCPLIPDKIDKEILELANKTLAASVPDLRNKLNLLGSDINPLILTDEFLGSGLVHIGYFENEKIWEILSLNIKIAFNELDESLGDSKEELIEWINNFKQTISNALNKIDVV